MTPASCELILALDLPDRRAALALLERCDEELRWVKIGLQLFTREGPALVEEIAARGHRIFLDLKLHDIPHTVAAAIHSLGPLPVDLLTVHASGGPDMLSAAADAAREAKNGPTLLAVTVLTSLNAAQLRAAGFAETPALLVPRLARLATANGCGGLVCSPLEVAALRETLGPRVTLVTPGIRPAGAALGDQQRVQDPASAARAGSNFIVVGRPITQADDPAAIITRIKRQLAAAKP